MSKECVIILTMKSKNVTITSKNQITLPIAMVRKLNVGPNRQLTIHRRGDELILKPAPTLDEIMTPIWKQTAAYTKRPFSDDELKQAARHAIATRGDR